MREADGTTVWVNPWRFSNSKKRSQRARISADSTSENHSAFFLARAFLAEAIESRAPATLTAEEFLLIKLCDA